MASLTTPPACLNQSVVSLPKSGQVAAGHKRVLEQRTYFLGSFPLKAKALVPAQPSRNMAIRSTTQALFGMSSNGNGNAPHADGDKTLTTAAGNPVGDNQNSVTAGSKGPLALSEDFHLFEKNAKFNRERVPPRVVHEQGTGAFGTFTVTNDITKYTKAKMFENVGKKTEAFVRFSTVSGEHGTADSIRDPRGFAMKFYTEQGNWDLVANNTPIFFIRDPMKFPDLIRSQKRDGRGLKSWTMRWDFWGLSPEATHQVLWLMGDRGLPASYRNMNGYGGHTFSMINAEDKRVYVKIHFKAQDGIKNLTDEEGIQLAGMNPDAYSQDLYNSIEEGKFPRWKMYIQMMSEREAMSLSSFDPFDITKVWPHGDYPLIEVGELELNRNPGNYFQDVEQAGFSPSEVVPGISFSPDRLLQGRLFAYPDAQNYRSGANAYLLPVNRPRCPVHTYHKDGAMRFDGNHGLDMPYEPNSFNGPKENPAYPNPPLPVPVNGDVFRYNHRVNTDEFSQASKLWALMEDDERGRVVKNITNTMLHGVGAGLKSEPVPKFIQQTNLYNFYRVSSDLGEMLAKSLGLDLQEAIEEGKSRQEKLVPSASPKEYAGKFGKG